MGEQNLGVKPMGEFSLNILNWQKRWKRQRRRTSPSRNQRWNQVLDRVHRE